MEVTKTAEAQNPAEDYYAEALDVLRQGGIPFMIGGAYAMREYAGIYRDTKDLDVFCKAGDQAAILHVLQDAGYTIELTDPVWLAKAFSGEHYVDVIWGSANGLCPVDDSWFEHALPVTLLGREIKLIPAEEEIWSKLYLRDRHRFDGADVNHLLRGRGAELDWKRLLQRLEPHWELLLSQLIAFCFVYPSDRKVVPEWLMRELLGRVDQQLSLPESKDRVCRGPLLSRTQYTVDINEWGYKVT